VKRIVESEVIWSLSTSEGYATAELNEDDNPAVIILFWSDEAYARRAKIEIFPDYKETTIPLFDILIPLATGNVWQWNFNRNKLGGRFGLP